MDSSSAKIQLHINRSSFGVISLGGFERVCGLYKFSLKVLSNACELSQYVGASALLEINERYISGVITETLDCEVILEPHLALAKLFSGLSIFWNKSILDVLKTILLNSCYSEEDIIFHVEKDHPLRPYFLQEKGETALNFFLKIVLENNLYFWFECINKKEVIHISDSLVFLPRVQNFYFHEKGKSDEKLIIWSDSCQVKVGHLIKIENQFFLIKRINHRAKQEIENLTQQVSYENTVTLQSLKKLDSVRFESDYSSVYLANVESESEYPKVNEKGQYYIKYKFDSKDKNNSIPITKLAPSYGWHLPLNNKTEVMLGSIKSDLGVLPIILGSFPNAEDISPVTYKNVNQNIIKTSRGHLLLMDDGEEEKIKIQTHDANNSIELLNNEKKEINILSKKGSLIIKAKENVYTKGKNLNENIKNKKTSIAEVYHHTKAKAVYNEAKNCVFEAESIHKNAKKKVNIFSHDFCLSSEANTKLSSENSLYKSCDNTIIEAENDVLIISYESILFRQNRSGFDITKDGSINFFGNSLEMLSDSGSINIRADKIFWEE